MKTRALVLVLVAAFAGIINFSSCDKVKTDKFDGTYDCTTVSDSDVDDMQLVIDDFEVIIDLQTATIDIDGVSETGIEVDKDGKFSATVEVNLLITEVDVEISGTVTSDGSISGTIKEKQDVIGVDMPVRTGTFSGSKE